MVFIAAPKLLSQYQRRTEDIDTSPHVAVIIIDDHGQRTQEVAGHPWLFADKFYEMAAVPQFLGHARMDHHARLTVLVGSSGHL